MHKLGKILIATTCAGLLVPAVAPAASADSSSPDYSGTAAQLLRELPGKPKSAARTAPVEYLVLDVLEDALGDTTQTPELVGAGLAVLPANPTEMVVVAVTSGATKATDEAAALFDTDNDGVTDLVSATEGGLPADTLVAFPVVRLATDGTETPTGVMAQWIRLADGYAMVTDFTKLGLSAVDYAFGLYEPATGATDIVPEQYLGVPLALSASAPGSEDEMSTSGTTPAKKKATLKVTTDKSRGYLRVDVNPNKGKGYWTLRVEKQNTKTGKWSKVKGSWKTQGNSETRSINLPKGTYRVVVAGKYGYAGATSAAVTLQK
ncbi:MAG: hypothetical protein ACOYEV_07730 [Candidatus Nanopelagicales bacterium]